MDGLDENDCSNGLGSRWCLDGPVLPLAAGLEGPAFSACSGDTSQFSEIQREAIGEGRGVWGGDGRNGSKWTEVHGQHLLQQ